MKRTVLFAVYTVLLCWILSTLTAGQVATTATAIPASDPKAVALASQSMAAMTGGNRISDVTLTSNITWTVGSESQIGSGLMQAAGNGESRIDFQLSSGTLSEVRDAQSGSPHGQWRSPGKEASKIAHHNCLTDAAWFFPALGSLAGNANTVLRYVGLESRDDMSVEHLRAYVHDPQWTKTVSPMLERLSTMDIYLNASTFLPVAITFNVHPDNDANVDLITEVDFSDYQKVKGVFVPMHIQKYQQGNLFLDVTVSNVDLNTGLGLAQFVVAPRQAGK